jgi:DNA-3-methyladenine glycosylase II
MTSISDAKQIRAAERHLRQADPAFITVMDAAGPCTIGTRSADDASPYSALVTSVVSQQLSNPIARTLTDRLRELVGHELDPCALSRLAVADLRGIGLSNAKARTIVELTDAIGSGRIDLDYLATHADDDTVMGDLTALWGIGPWTAHMFMIFHLGRLDVWPTGDLGVRKGWQVVHGADGDPGPEHLRCAADHLQPYRSVAAWYCWRAWEASS